MDKKAEERIINYLYDEMSQDERAAFEKDMESNPELKEEVKGLSVMRGALGQVTDKEVVPPSFVFNESKVVGIPFFRSNAFQWVSSIAAGLLLLMVSAYMLDFRMSSTQTGTEFAFGERVEAPVEQTLSKENVQDWMKEVMAEMDKGTDTKLMDLELRLADKIDSQDQKYNDDLQKLAKQYSSGTDQLMRQYVAQVNDENKQMIESFFEVSNEAQQEYMQSVLADFNEFYQNQRSHDLQVIEASIDLVKNNYDVKQLEQESLLANLYSIVQTQSK